MLITINLQGGQAHGKIVRVDLNGPGYKVPILSLETKAKDGFYDPAELVTIREVLYKPVYDKGKPLKDANGYFYYEP